MSNAIETFAIRTALLTGDTFRFRGILKDKGWKWNAEERAWSKAADWRDEAEVIATVRSYGGIRNRGSFSVAFE
jgi:hypothetical protein